MTAVLVLALKVAVCAFLGLKVLSLAAWLIEVVRRFLDWLRRVFR